MTRVCAWVASLVLGIVVLGCGADDEPVAEPSPEASGGGSGSTGVITGVVRLAPGAELPGYPDNPMEPTPGRPAVPDACTAPTPEDQHPVQLGPGRGLEGVLVAVSDFSEAPPHEPETHEMVIRDCRLSPRLLVATRGDRLRLTNETDYPFLPDLGTGMMQAVLHNRSRELELGQGGARTLNCGFAAQCGRAEVVTLYHSLHDATEDGGHFRIENVPAGEEVRVSAWHPVLGEVGQRVQVEAGDRNEIELVLTPTAAAPAPAEPTPAPEGPSENNPDILF